MLGEQKLQCLQDQVSEIANAGWIKRSVSPWSAPPFFVAKKPHEPPRMVIDYRDLNALTVNESVPLPRLEVLLHRARSTRVFSKLDLASGFHQIELAPDSRALTAFCLPEPVLGCCLWEWHVMPFGLKNAPPTFQRAMNIALSGCEPFCVVYLDDILVFSPDLETHVEHLRQVFRCLNSHGYHVRLSKCDLVKKEVEFLGHKLTAEGLEVASPKVEALKAWNPPLKNIKQVRQFLGLALWYKTFVPHLASLAVPLFNLVSTRRTFGWNEAASQAVCSIQKLVTEAPCLARWSPELDTRVTTDASAVGLGAVLEQRHDEQWRPVAFWSRRLKPAEIRYSTTDREWLAVVDAVTRRWRGFLDGKPFVVRSDHAALARKLSRTGNDPPDNDRQCRWIERLMPFSLTFEYVKGTNNAVADALSRSPSLCTLTVVRSLLHGLLEVIRQAAQFDPSYQDMLKGVSSSPSISDKVVENGLVKEKTNEVWVPDNPSIRTFLLSEAHDTPLSGHFGTDRTLYNLRQKWRWRGMARDVDDYVSSCLRCQRSKHRNIKPPGQLHPILATQPGEIITLDFVSKFAPANLTRHMQCLVLTDKFSRFVMLEGCPLECSAEEAARIFIKRVIPLFGFPIKVISDRGPQFTAILWQEVLSVLGCRAALAATHHPQTDGSSERTIQNLLRLIRTYAGSQQAAWEEMLPIFESSLNSSKHSSTSFSPHEVAFGWTPRGPLEFALEEDPSTKSPFGTAALPTLKSEWVAELQGRLRDIHELVTQKQDKSAYLQKKYYDRNRKELLFEPGDLVLLSSSVHPILEGYRKHRPRFIGPFSVKKRIHPNSYQLAGLPPQVPKVQNVRYLRPFHPSPARFGTRPESDFARPQEVDGQVEWLVEAIVEHRRTRNGLRYKVKWADWDQCQWLRERDLANCVELVREYHELHQLPLPTMFERAPTATQPPTSSPPLLSQFPPQETDWEEEL